MILIVIDGETIRRELSYEICIELMCEAMGALSRGETHQLPRMIMDLGDDRSFGVMPGAMPAHGGFGAKLVSVFSDGRAHGLPSHQGVMVLFDSGTGAPVCVLNAGELTAIRTACASAAATRALARDDACHLAVLGCGEQALSHSLAIAKVRPLDRITLWGRSIARAEALAAEIALRTGIPTEVAQTVALGVRDADIICTVTAAAEPILERRWVAPGTHVNLVGSSRAGPAEIDSALVLASRYFADHRASVVQQGAEFIHAKAAGLIDDSHLLGEIGAVFNGTLAGRQASSDITLYKSLGNVVQDIVSGWWLYENAVLNGFGKSVSL